MVAMVVAISQKLKKLGIYMTFTNVFIKIENWEIVILIYLLLLPNCYYNLLNEIAI